MVLDGLPGESRVVAYVGEIDLLSGAWSDAQATAGGAASGRVAIEDVVLLKPGRPLKDAMVSFERRVGATRFEFVRVTLTDAQVMSEAIVSLAWWSASRWNLAASSSGIHRNTRTGTAGAAVTAGRDTVTSRPM
jgi:type VI protein secretion system component Hcp